MTRYLFKHILMRDAVYGMQLHSRLHELHRRAAEEIEEKTIDHLRKADDYPRETATKDLHTSTPQLANRKVPRSFREQRLSPTVTFYVICSAVFVLPLHHAILPAYGYWFLVNP